MAHFIANYCDLDRRFVLPKGKFYKGFGAEIEAWAKKHLEGSIPNAVTIGQYISDYVRDFVPPNKAADKL